MERDKSMTTIKSLWEEHYNAAFPKDIADEEIEGIDIVLLDTYTAGCISTFVSCGGRLDRDKYAILNTCKRELSIVGARLEGDSRVYFERLDKIATMILKALRYHV